MPHEKIIREKIKELNYTIEQFADKDEHGFPLLSDDIRWDLHVLACSLHDSTFWVRKSRNFPDFYEATEVETGVSAWGISPNDALSNHINGYFEQPG